MSSDVGLTPVHLVGYSRDKAEDVVVDVELNVLGCRTDAGTSVRYRRDKAEDVVVDVELNVLGCRTDAGTSVRYRRDKAEDVVDVELNVLGGCRVDILGTNRDQSVSMIQCCFTSAVRNHKTHY